MHSYEEYNEPIQKLIKIMRDDYPNGFEMRINGFSATGNEPIQKILELQKNSTHGVI